MGAAVQPDDAPQRNDCGQRLEDCNIALALQPAQKPALFEVAELSVPSRITEAPAHVGRAGRAGVVLIDFSNDRRGA
jgi:hypothetical protein